MGDGDWGADGQGGRAFDLESRLLLSHHWLGERGAIAYMCTQSEAGLEIAKVSTFVIPKQGRPCSVFSTMDASRRVNEDGGWLPGLRGMQGHARPRYVKFDVDSLILQPQVLGMKDNVSWLMEMGIMITQTQANVYVCW
jgi:hypothetical protein